MTQIIVNIWEKNLLKKYANVLSSKDIKEILLEEIVAIP